MNSKRYNFELLQAMLAELDAYLLSNELFWPLSGHPPSGEPPFPRMTLGNLLLALDELGAQADTFSEEEESRFAELRSQWEKHLHSHGTAIERKAATEQRQRLQLWRNFLDELREGSPSGANYAQQARSRAIFDRLADLIAGEGQDESLQKSMAALDTRFRGRFAPGPFVLDPGLQRAYDPEQYWYLYGQPST